jgi:hypothetical protein
MVNNLIIIANFLTISKHKDIITNFFNILANDSSWRVKYKIADNLGDIIQSLGRDIGRNFVVPAFVKFLENEEAEVIFNILIFLQDHHLRNFYFSYS